MLKIGGRPILQIILEELKKYGLNNILISVNFKSHIIENYFGDGKKFGVSIEYIREEEPLGTAGSLSLVEEDFVHPAVALNGDLLTNINFDFFIKHYFEFGSDALMCVRDYEVEVPFGVIESKDNLVQKIKEKPREIFLVNAGIYLLSSKCIKLIKKGEKLNMPELLERIIENKLTVGTYRLQEYWLDIGRVDDFEKANEEVSKVIK